MLSLRWYLQLDRQEPKNNCKKVVDFHTNTIRRISTKIPIFKLYSSTSTFEFQGLGRMTVI